MPITTSGFEEADKINHLRSTCYLAKRYEG